MYVSTIVSSLLLTAGFFISLFIVWKRLREDYPEHQIFSSVLILGIGALLGYAVVGGFFPVITFWITVFLGGFFGFLRAKHYAIRPFEFLEAITPAAFVFLLFVYGVALVQGVEALWFGGAEELLTILSLGSFFFISRSFRKFTWYPSGKLGIASLVSLGLYAILRAILAGVAPNMLFFSHKVLDIVFGSAASVICLILLYVRSGREAKQDFRFLPFWHKKHIYRR